MARKRSLFLSQLSTILKTGKYFFLGLVVTLLIIAYQGVTFAGNPSLETAQALNQQGAIQLQQGQAQAALRTWQLTYKAYQKLKNQSGMAGSLINQSLAYQANGSYLSACQVLAQALKLENWACPNSGFQNGLLNQSLDSLNQALQKQPVKAIHISGLYHLGVVLRLLGEPESSFIVLQKALTLNQNLTTNSKLTNKLLLSLANTEYFLYKQAKNRYELIEEPIAKHEAFTLAISKLNSSFQGYQQLTKKQDISSLKAGLNLLNLLLDVKNSPLSAYLNSNILNQISLLVVQLLKSVSNFQQLPLIESIYSRINFAENLVTITEDNIAQNLKFSQKGLLDSALFLAQEALTDAQKLNNRRAVSYSLGTIGQIQIILKHPLQAQHNFEQAIALAQSVQAWDIAYQWQWKLGQLYKHSGATTKSRAAYAAAISNLDQVMGSILGVNPEFQFAFQDKVEPVYHEYIDILLSEKHQDFLQAIKTQDKLRLTEIETFLRCGKLPFISLIEGRHSQKLPPLIYYIKIKNDLKIIVRTPQGKFFSHSFPFDLISDAVNNLITFTQKPQFVNTQEYDFISDCQTLYKFMFAPIKQYLPERGSLIFALDRYLQNLPINMLHDGQKYLIDPYSISYDLNSQFIKTKPLNPRQLTVLVAGIFKDSPSLKHYLVPQNLKSLPEIQIEIEKIKSIATSATQLLNEQFTNNQLQQKFSKSKLQIVHLSTHAQYSSDPIQNFILAWDRPLNIQDIKSILFKNYSGIDLLVLSACQTAKGDKRSALGIAGIAAQAGARSTIASLWLVDAESTALLMEAFYQGLRNGLTKAEALRQAQLTLLSNSNYAHPYYWAPFVLIGNWI